MLEERVELLVVWEKLENVSILTRKHCSSASEFSNQQQNLESSSCNLARPLHLRSNRPNKRIPPKALSLIATEEEEKSRGSEKKMNERKLEEIGAGVWHNFPGTKADWARKQASERSRATFEEEAVGKKEDDASFISVDSFYRRRSSRAG